MTYLIDLQKTGDAAAVERLIETCFGPNRNKRTVYAFRDGIPPYPEFCFVVRDDDGELVASLRFWPVQLPDGRVLPLLGPLAVEQALRGKGVGKALLRHGIEAVRQAGHDGILIIGDPAYYTQFGFSESHAVAMEMPGSVHPLTFMALDFERDGSVPLKTVEGVVTPVPSVIERQA
ncbi:GNAT family N-acetyltransferase [Aestuariispira ectoiniformans]|uniref:GNAT family N-acetyltransferase n=1 Tax=Aestuariispira ectoiniformans TaxID=2775080 RepID=UPI00223BE1B0|nr:N-acetyltransferase [Aestuariispira ectoiniformans]